MPSMHDTFTTFLACGMNKFIAFTGTIGAALLVLTSCYKTEVLEPVEIPELLQLPIFRIEVFDNGVMAAVTDGGIFVQYSEGQDWIAHTSGTVSAFRDIQWSTIEFFLDPENNLWAVDDDFIVQITRDEVNTVTQSLQSLYPVSGYGMSPEGKLYRADYWDDGYNEDLEWVYYLRLSVWEDGIWDTINTRMEVPENNYSDPSVAFDENGTLYICSNPVYKVTEITSAGVQYETNVPTTSGFTMKSIQHPLVAKSNVQGFDRYPTNEQPITRAYTFNMVSGVARETVVKDECIYPDEAIGPVKILSQHAGKTVMFVKMFTNNYSESTAILGFLAEGDFLSGGCIVRQINASEQVPFSSNITDVDIMESTNELLMGTSGGLMIYDLETHEVSTYLEHVLQLDIE